MRSHRLWCQVRSATKNVWEASGRLCIEDVKALLLGSAVKRTATTRAGGGGEEEGAWAAEGLDGKTAR